MRHLLLSFLLLGCGTPAPDETTCEDGVDCPEDCADASDNDGDGGIDCSDTDCAAELACDQDRDDDGFIGPEWGGDDCNDDDPGIHPGTVEVCDGVDNNCDGLADDDDPGLDQDSLLEWFRDNDEDGFGVNGPAQLFCQGPVGSAPNTDDCDDNDANRNPDAQEICNNIDDDCDGQTDDADPDVDLTGADTFYVDADNDQDGDPTQSITACTRPNGYSPAFTDCDDNDPAVTGRDVDGDGLTSCDGDCDDFDININPSADEVCNNADDDCDTLVDEADPDLLDARTFYLDYDGDNDGDILFSIVACVQPLGYASAFTDCDDNDPLVTGLDVDGDGLTSCDGDCDDFDAALNLDDSDGDGFTTCAGDCDPVDPGAYPGAVEIPGDCVDQDCDGLTGDLGCSGCSNMATWSAEIAPDLWLCSFNNMSGKSWPETWGVCNEASGFYMPTVGSMTRRGLPSDGEIAPAMNAANANGHDYVTSGHPARSCSWDSVLTSYEACNGLGYINTSETTGLGSNWQAITDGDTADYRNWPAANSTGAHPLATICQDASGDPAAVIFDHRWQ